MTPAARAIRFSGIKDIGCICCKADGLRWVYAEIHHQLSTGFHGNGKRLGDEFTIGLCMWHHRGLRDDSCRYASGPSYAAEAAAFRVQYGDDTALLNMQDRLLQRDRPMFGGAN